MSEALFTRSADGRHQARSAGTTPAGQIHPKVRQAMAELGIDLAGHAPKQLTRAMADWADIVVTMGCGDECPYIPGRRYLDWDLSDPRGKLLSDVRLIRDEITRRVERLLAELDS